MEELTNFSGKHGEPVPQVDPDDLKTVFEFVRKAAKDHPGERLDLALRFLEES